MNRRRLASIAKGGISVRRLADAFRRRLVSFPHNLAYALRSGPQSENYRRILALRGAHAGERCFVLGNGPSLAKMDLAPLQKEVSFGTNRVFLLFEDTHFRPTYYVCINSLMMHQSRREIEGLEMPRFLNWRNRGIFADPDRMIFLRESFRAHFSHDLTRGVWGGGTVTYAALQIAYYMGFRQAITIGLDHNYAAAGRPHEVTESDGLARDHFHPAYFPTGFRWQLPDLATSEFAYHLAKDAYEADGREILDATIGGKLQVFRKVEFNTLVA